MSRHRIHVTAFSGLLALSGLGFGADLSGDWIAQIASTGAPQYYRVSLHVDGGAMTGMLGRSKIEGTVAGSKIDLKLTATEGGLAGTLNGTLTGDTVSGSGTAVATAEAVEGAAVLAEEAPRAP